MDLALRSQLRRAPAHRRAEVGSKVIVRLRGGGRVEGILAHRTDNFVVIRNDGGEVVVLESATLS
jgi:hypothetical protein